ncbi:putative ternary complex factor MIP1, leucine-zipper [Dioscorea sansibarensis]
MTFEVNQNTRMRDLESHSSMALEAVVSRNVIAARHKRSKSDSERGAKRDKLDWSPKSFHHVKLDAAIAEGKSEETQMPRSKVQSSLKKEIQQLEKRLKDQFMVRRALEKALGYSSSAIDSSNDSSMPKLTKELIREIAVLEFEVMYLEQYLLSLYRRAFDQQICTLSPATVDERSKQSLCSLSGHPHEVAKPDIASMRGDSAAQHSEMVFPRKSFTNSSYGTGAVGYQHKLNGHGVNRSHSSILHHSCFSARMSPVAENLCGCPRVCHSQPLSPFDHGQNPASGVISLAEYLGTNITDHIPETPGKLSEDMVRCMGSIYCKIADPPLMCQGRSSSPTSSFSSMSAFSPQYVGDMWSPGCKRGSTLDSRLENPFQVEGLKEFSGPYNTMVEVPSICRENLQLPDIEDTLLNYKSLVRQLESVDPRKMNADEKLAFWINIHNALMMHAYLDHGIPQNNVKRASLFTKAAYSIGGHSINLDTIQGLILRCRTHRPGQWLRALLSTRTKFKAGDDWRAYAIEQQEPLIHFALCSGNYSDPAVRIYSSRRLFQQLETAKVEYIRATVGIRKEQKILLPKIVDSFAKDKGMCLRSLLDMIQLHLPETLRMVMQRCQQGKSQKIIEWVPHNASFRYLLSRELAIPQVN